MSATQTPPRVPRSTNGLAVPDFVSAPQKVEQSNVRYLWAVIRLGMAWTFLWPFFDKMFGLNHDSTTAQAWINGG